MLIVTALIVIGGALMYGLVCGAAEVRSAEYQAQLDEEQWEIINSPEYISQYRRRHKSDRGAK